MSSLKCDRWPRSNLESCLAAVCAVSGLLILQATWLCHGIGAVAARWPACCLLAHGRPMGVNGRAGGGPACWAVRRLGRRETKMIFEAGRNTKYSTRLSVTYTSRTHTHTHPLIPLGLRNGPTYAALALWLNGPPCKWSGVEPTVAPWRVALYKDRQSNRGRCFLAWIT